MHLRRCNGLRDVGTHQPPWQCETSVIFAKIHFISGFTRYQAKFIPRPDGLVVVQVKLDKFDRHKGVVSCTLDCANYHAVALLPNEIIQIMDGNSVRQL